MTPYDEALTKAAQTAALLTSDLREAHKAVCALPDDAISRTAQALLLERIRAAAALRNELAAAAGVTC